MKECGAYLPRVLTYSRLPLIVEDGEGGGRERNSITTLLCTPCEALRMLEV
jgi:hypothetical protein